MATGGTAIKEPNIILSSTPTIAGKTQPTKTEYFLGSTPVESPLPQAQVERYPIRTFESPARATERPGGERPSAIVSARSEISSGVTNPMTSYNPSAPVSYRSPGGVPYGAAFEPGGIFYSRPVTEEDEESIREKARKDVQAQIDAINELASTELEAARVRGRERLGQTRALGAATGVLGSPTGEAQKEKTYQVNVAEERAIRAAAAERVANIQAGVNTRADAIIQASRTLARENAGKFMEFLKTQSTDARADMKSLAATGAELSSDQRQKLIDQTGYDPETFDQLYQGLKIANAPANVYINKDKPEIIGNKAVFFKQNTDGTISTETVDLPASGTKEIQSVSTSKDNGVIVFYKDGTWKQVGAGHPSDSGISGDISRKTQQFDYLKTVADEAMNLADAAGRSALRRGLEEKYVGSTDYTNLVAVTNTLRTNLLTLLADPDVKKFFGPQMSNADVQFMMAGGTTLNPELQSPEKLKAELTRVKETIRKARVAVAGGVGEEVGGSDVQTRAATAGYDYEKMKAQGYDDAAIDAALKAEGK